MNTTTQSIKSEIASKIAAKVRGLMGKTVENGATEAEAMGAAEKARQLMEEHQLTLSDVEIRAEGLGEHISDVDATSDGLTKVNKGLGLRFIMIGAVSAFCDVEGWRGQDKYGHRVVHFLGLKQDVEFAAWLLDSLTTFTLNHADTWRTQLPGYMGRGERWQQYKGFVLGCAGRITVRLRQLADARKIKAAGNGRALVVVKNAMITEEMAKRGLKLRRISRKVRANAGYEAGTEAGDRASFNRPLNGGAPVLRIGRH